MWRGGILLRSIPQFFGDGFCYEVNEVYAIMCFDEYDLSDAGHSAIIRSKVTNEP